MIEGLIGKKIGMTEFFLEDGTVVPATIVKAGPCFVVQKRTLDKDKYESLQLGFDEIKPQRATKPILGHFKRAGVPPLRFLREFKILEGNVEDYNLGDVIKVDVFKAGDVVDVTGTSKGKGFAGVMKRHGFQGQPDSHGGMSHRRPGSIGQHSYPARVWKGIGMAGHMGADKVTMQELQVIKVEPEKNLIMIKGSIPGPNGSTVVVRHTAKGRVKSASA